MALFGLFSKEKKEKTPKGFYNVTIAEVKSLTDECVMISFDIPKSDSSDFKFKPGQFIEIMVNIDGKDERRDYSICSGKNETLAIAVKSVSDGNVSKWINTKVKAGQDFLISKPHGNFVVDDNSKNIVAIAAGSGITPIMSIAKEIESRGGNLRLFYGSRTVKSIIFKEELDALSNTFVQYFISGEQIDGFENGRIDKNSFTDCIKNDLSILKADEFLICGPEQMIFDAVTALKFFGVPEKKIHFELFSPSDLFAPKESEAGNSFQGIAKIAVILDGEKSNFELEGDGKTILDACNKEGIDAPYNCRGGVCSSCRAKIISGSVMMSKNYTLTDEEVAEGYILTCQAHPTSKELTISFDE
ncbi:MAG: 2Fe-2S iron-sulfur cluster-binding protein [Bacteroidota bacterium]